ncbi:MULTISPECIES: gamma-mobile-trio protein GmtX [Pseudomonas]|uniref:gamma-mobile-trio protein GmtX n=1 Tax=Pseudomonas TaxID=286 RepID=UPI000CD3B94F|nr:MULTISPECIES: gamma-mobile-trio protein GmtX [Pseudomonas]MCE1003082.1 hypothetical protein [Pseudomonas sp. NMI1173_11]POF94880.1 hypothetical protein BGP83_20100 [Pseudomonas putida]
MTPEEMLQYLCEKAPRQKASLKAVYAVCKEQAESGSTDFSYSAIARLGIDRGVPKVQSIRNKTGENYQALIKCFEGTLGARKRTPKSRSGDAWADQISDPKLRILVQRLLAELAEAQRTVKEFIPPGTKIRVDDRSNASSDFKLTNVERRAIEHLKTDDFLQQWKLIRGEKGDVVDERGKVVFKPGTMQAIEKVLKYL